MKEASAKERPLLKIIMRQQHDRWVATQNITLSVWPVNIQCCKNVQGRPLAFATVFTVPAAIGARYYGIYSACRWRCMLTLPVDNCVCCACYYCWQCMLGVSVDNSVNCGSCQQIQAKSNK
jgi:hypothetical protein